MDSAFDIPDSTDWLKTPLFAFSSLENALHCQICKEFYDTPMITSCAHTFCSKCIRTSLSTDGRCPACRTTDQASKLRNNWALQEVVSNFLVARPAAIELARREPERQSNERRSGKRKRIVLDSDDIADYETTNGRTTRSKSRRVTASQSSQPEVVEVEDSDGESEYHTYDPPADGLVECPLGCGKRMKINEVDPHLDRCEEERAQSTRAKLKTPVNGTLASRASSSIAKQQDRISELNYSLLNETKLRKKVEELGLPGWGGKPLLVKRHTAWVNLWNANCDSSHPRTKRELLQDLDVWERTQGGKAPSATGLASTVMRKDFDGAGWANRNRDDFSRLIAEAKRKKSRPALEEAKANDVKSDMDSSALAAPVHSSFEGTAENPHPTETAQNDDTNSTNASSHQPDSFMTSEVLQPATISTNVTNERAPPDRQCSRDEHLSNGPPSGSPCDLAAHLTTPAVKKVPMFAVPSASMTDANASGETK